MRHIGKWLLRIVVIITISTALLASVTLAPVDHTLPEQQPFYPIMMQRLDSALSLPLPTDTASLRVGFGKASIVPAWPTATAGYVKRKGAKFTSVRDSVFVRIMTFEKGNVRVAVVSLDMLIVPPLMIRMLENEISDFLLTGVFFGATHTHNSIGQWDDHLVGEIYAGDYDEALMHYLTTQIKKALGESLIDLKKTKLHVASVPVKEAVTNRLIPDGPVDSLLHVVVAEREDGSKGILTSYSAHATCLSSKDLRLSADYPGELVRKLEANGYDFAMFLAGAVGSHAPVSMPDGDAKIDYMASALEQALRIADTKNMHVQKLQFHRIPLLLSRQQIRISANWRIRPWLSELLLGEARAALTVLQIGDWLCIGTPCDFSGMLTRPVYEMAANQDLQVMVTSFNGGYIGYITPDKYYDLDAYETQTMNWYGPGNGKYLTDCMVRIIQNVRK